MLLLKILIQNLRLSMLKHNGDIKQGGVAHAMSSDTEVRLLQKILQETGYTVVCTMKSSKVPVGVYNGRSCDLYTSIVFDTNNPDLIDLLEDLGFKQDKHTATNMIYKL